ncbi:MAG TPA: M20/M25/M40 family metallo-hydrolase [Pyrinomonadaceae bacterium]|nr:M20/M25/M40 family metallo-hydrolase [Pyrinomonadaceae bacterium]
MISRCLIAVLLLASTAPFLMNNTHNLSNAENIAQAAEALLASTATFLKSNSPNSPDPEKIGQATAALLASTAPFLKNNTPNSPRSEKIAQAAEALRDKLIAQRRDFHMHPELSNREERTARVVAEKLKALGLTDIKTGIAHHGVTALLVGGKPGPVVAVRADMDALPIEETIDVPYNRIHITIRGKSSHAQPHAGIDAIVVAAECISALQNIRSRRIDPQEPLVISIGMIQGGTRNNIIAAEVKMEGTMRTLNEEVRTHTQSLMRETLQNVTAAYGATFELEFEEGAAVTYNEPALVEATLPTIKRVVGERNVLSIRPLMPAEDFSYFQKVVPGFYYFLGVANRQRGITAGWHTPEFDVDEESLVVGVKVMSNVLVDYLQRHAPDSSRGR